MKVQRNCHPGLGEVPTHAMIVVIPNVRGNRTKSQRTFPTMFQRKKSRNLWRQIASSMLFCLKGWRRVKTNNILLRMWWQNKATRKKISEQHGVQISCAEVSSWKREQGKMGYVSRQAKLLLPFRRHDLSTSAPWISECYNRGGLHGQ